MAEKAPKKEEFDEKGEKKPKSAPPAQKRQIRVVRILGTDIDGSRKLVAGIAEIKGIGFNLARAILLKLNLSFKKRLTDLTDPELAQIEKAIQNPGALGIPAWMFNRRKDLDTGKDLHLSTSDLAFAIKSDKDLMGETKSYKGLRLARGLKVRGQRTASTGRGKSAVGVQRKKNAPAQAGKK